MVKETILTGQAHLATVVLNLQTLVVPVGLKVAYLLPAQDNIVKLCVDVVVDDDDVWLSMAI